MIDRLAWFEQRRAGLQLARVIDETSGRERLAGVRAVASRSGALELYARGQVAVDEALVDERPALDASAGIADRVMSALAEEPRQASGTRGLRRSAGFAAAFAVVGAGLWIAASRYPSAAPTRNDPALVSLRVVVDDLRGLAEQAYASIGSSIDTVDQAVRGETKALTSDVRWAVGLIVDRIPVPTLWNKPS